MASKITLLSLMLAILTACSNTMQLNLSSLPDPSYTANIHLPVTIIAEGSPESRLKAKYFLPQIQQQFIHLGYNDVRLGTDKTAAEEGLLVKVKVSTEKVSYQYTATEYGYNHVEPIQYCHSSADNKIICNTTYRPVYGPIGSSQRTAYTRLSSFIVTVIEVLSDEPVLQIKAISYNDNCSDTKVEAFLAEQLLLHFETQQRIEQKIKVKMDKNYSCK
ncbi:hypothetical protein VQ643_14635 [Pseudomonas sp. F1_0610]|uniref:hypothetical protein n=1 Tax=Pseudomonas sp. F1_0610 TaxID=3114284 RepID=UPI0039C22E81